MLTIYGASAGSGKTFQLTQSYITLLFLLQKKAIAHPHRRILAVTFTNKATEEMKSRILEELFKLSEGTPSPYREGLAKQFAQPIERINEIATLILTDLLHDYAYFSISTIDKFFLQIVRTFGRELGIAGHQNVFLDTEEILQQATDNFFLNLTKEKEKSMQWLEQFMEANLTTQKNWRVQDQISNLGRELFKENYQTFAEKTHEKLHDKEFLRAYQAELHSIKKTFEKSMQEAIGEFQSYLQKIGITEDIFKGKYLFSKLESLKKGEYELTATFIGYAESADKCYTKSASSDIKAQITSNYPEIQKHLQNIIQLFDAPLIAYNTADIVLKNIYTMGLLSDLATEIKNIADEQHLIILSNINSLLNKVIDKSDTPFIYERTGLRVRHFMIDEFQDTSSLQWKNFKPLIANSLSEGKSNLLVGDVKQSIYRWRNSDWKLMQEQVQNDIAKQQIKRETLTHNWRSDTNIVEFNNLFFVQAAQLLHEQLHTEIDESIGDVSSETQQLPQKITNAYQDVVQKPTSSAAGFVHVEFVEEIPESKWQEEVMKKIPPHIEKLTTEGYKPSDIAFLVRKKEQAVMLTNFMMQYKKSDKAKKGVSYDLIGNEGIQLSSSATVGFIISLLKLIHNPLDQIQYVKMTTEYQKANNIPLSVSIQHRANEKPYPDYFSEREKECVESIKSQSIYQAVEQIISTFGLAAWYDEHIFLHALQDEIYSFSNRKAADLYSFLKWWDKNETKRYINLPENENAMQVMTIHKSKGLDFKIVIMPFLDWEFDAKNPRPLLWIKSQTPPFNQIEQLPIHYTSKLKDTTFKDAYFDEKMHQYVDNLNVTYVAFTRARNGVIYFAPKKKEAEKIEFKKRIPLPELLLKLMHTHFATHQSPTDKNIYQIGKPYQPKEHHTTTTDNISYKKTTNYPICLQNNRIKLKKINKATSEHRLSDSRQSRADFGIIMHEILQQITDKESQNSIIESMTREGKIQQQQQAQIRQELDKFWQQPKVKAWFSTSGNIYNEATILLPNQQTYRPDKVIIEKDKAIVIDYKFGEKEQQHHKKQIAQYTDILQKMGYKTEGYLYYVSLQKIIQCP